MSLTTPLHPHLEIPEETRQRLRTNPVGEREIVLVCVVRNEHMRLAHFMTFYRALGIERFVFIDNLSTDGTWNFLAAEPDVLLFRANGRYSESRCGIDWSNSLTLALAPANWVLTVDADEYFIYPDYDNRSIYALRDHLETVGATAFRAPMLDLYPRTPLQQTPYEIGSDPFSTHRYFDAEGYEFNNFEGQRLLTRGGPRKRIFWDEQTLDHPSPFLMKIPFARWQGEPLYSASTHLCPDQAFSETTGLIMHLKFLGDFHVRVNDEARRGEHFADARQYKAYDAIAQRSDRLTLYSDISAEFIGPEGLVDRGLMYRGRF